MTTVKTNSTSIVKKEKSKILYLEIMRIISIFFVIFNHTGKDGYFLFASKPIGSLSFWCYLFIAIFCKFSIYLFLAISGALLLAKDTEPIKKVWTKRISKIILVLLFISIFYYLNNLNWNFHKFDIKDFMVKFFTNPNGINGHLWYLYLYLAFLISIPFIRSMVKNLENKHFYYMIGIALVFSSIIPILEYFLGQNKLSINSSLKVTWLGSKIIFYPCIGYFLYNKFVPKKPKLLISVLWLINIFTIGISCYLTYFVAKKTGTITEGSSQTFFQSFSSINCITLFITIKYLFEKIKFNKYIEKFLISLGSCTFCIYLFHPWIKNLKIMLDLSKTLNTINLNSMIICFIWCTIIMLITYILSLILSKIPIIRKLFF